MTKTYGFPKSEHLCLQRDIDALFSGADGTATAWPIRCLWRRATPDSPNQVLISVAKRHLHHAVDRNRAKRQIREAYRLQKHSIQGGLHIAFVWMADAPVATSRIHDAIGRLLQKIASAQ